MRFNLKSIVIGTGPRIYHVTVYVPENAHGSMCLVAGPSLAQAIYTAWGAVRGREALDLTQCDGYLIGEFE